MGWLISIFRFWTFSNDIFVILMTTTVLNIKFSYFSTITIRLNSPSETYAVRKNNAVFNWVRPESANDTCLQNRVVSRSRESWVRVVLLFKNRNRFFICYFFTPTSLLHFIDVFQKKFFWFKMGNIKITCAKSIVN